MSSAMNPECERREVAVNRPASTGPRRRAVDPFFIFTYSLLALAGAIQVLVMVWMDLF